MVGNCVRFIIPDLLFIDPKYLDKMVRDASFDFSEREDATDFDDPISNRKKNWLEHCTSSFFSRSHSLIYKTGYHLSVH